MSDTRTPQEPGEELKRLLTVITTAVCQAARIENVAERTEMLSQIQDANLVILERWAQSRIPEVSEEARDAKLYENFLRLWHFADTCAAEGIDVETSTGNIDSGLLCVTVAGQMAPKHVEWFEQANKFNADFRALLSEKS